MPDTSLFVSRNGEVACSEHAPDEGSVRWQEEGWRRIEAYELRRSAVICQHCTGQFRAGADAEPPLVLNVDDRAENRYLRDRALREHGFNVANAATGREAVEIGRQVNPQIILLDVHLGDVDGRELCLQIKEDPELKHIPVVLISSTLGGDADRVETIRWAAADGFIHEPVEPSVLASTLRKVLSAKK